MLLFPHPQLCSLQFKIAFGPCEPVLSGTHFLLPWNKPSYVLNNNHLLFLMSLWVVLLVMVGLVHAQIISWWVILGWLVQNDLS